ncbi:hypothetical protein GEV33_008086 [Tenebrio molitor]|uniref:Uncharacterized protein n=1 Tax=Tenebrio molitor TaxID=7067 RepID=A0A8J6H9R0_TENMO|nr:hypothetical protein GEV33_008086 [Tenebrio molitor]
MRILPGGVTKPPKSARLYTRKKNARSLPGPAGARLYSFLLDFCVRQNVAPLAAIRWFLSAVQCVAADTERDHADRKSNKLRQKIASSRGRVQNQKADAGVKMDTRAEFRSLEWFRSSCLSKRFYQDLIARGYRNCESKNFASFLIDDVLIRALFFGLRDKSRHQNIQVETIEPSPLFIRRHNFERILRVPSPHLTCPNPRLCAIFPSTYYHLSVVCFSRALLKNEKKKWSSTITPELA